jgi:selenocysteine lyase/cysteine desulfurase
MTELIQHQFPTLEKMIYVNHAALSPWPRVTAEAVSRFASENVESGPMHTARWLLTEKRLRKMIADMLGAASGEDIALLKNTSEGINLVANGVDWRAGDNLVTPAEEFVSNQMAWDELSKLGVEVRKVRVSEAEYPESALIDMMDERTRVLTVSAVQWDSGLRLNLERLGQACANTPILFFVDAIQQFPVIPIDVEACRIDALAASAHKWQMGPEGIALFYCHSDCRKQLKLKQHGWRMLDHPYLFARPDRLPSTTAQRFEAGSPNTLGQTALFASLGLFCEFGLERINQRVMANTEMLINGLANIIGIELSSHPEPDRRSGIVSFEPKRIKPELLARNLSKRKVFVAVRGMAIRLSPHFYQSSGMMDDLLNTLEDEVIIK